MRSGRLPLWLGITCAPLVAACNAIFGITPLEVYESDPEECEGAPSHDREGCLCDTAGAEQECHHGVPGPQSACDEPGIQPCTEGADGALRWGACTGGSLPSPVEYCYEDHDPAVEEPLVDDDCDGIVNPDCYCTEARDLCAGLLPDQYNFFTDPPQPRFNEPFQLFVVSKLTLAMPAIDVESQGCLGTPVRPCASPGAGCTDWNHLRFTLQITEVGTFTVKLFVNDLNDGTDPPCSPGEPITTYNIVVAP